MQQIHIDFLSGKNAYRRQHGGGKKQMLAKAVGIKPGFLPTIVDATAGLGGDSYVLASLGCTVVMLERSPIIAELLGDGLRRLKSDSLGEQLHLELICAEAKDYLANLSLSERPDVIYLDPMYPHQKKSALAKKEMRILREVVGADEDAAALLEIALCYAKKRVVVKRARLAPMLGETKPDLVFTGQSSRFDVYFSLN